MNKNIKSILFAFVALFGIVTLSQAQISYTYTTYTYAQASEIYHNTPTSQHHLLDPVITAIVVGNIGPITVNDQTGDWYDANGNFMSNNGTPGPFTGYPLNQVNSSVELYNYVFGATGSHALASYLSAPWMLVSWDEVQRAIEDYIGSH